MTIEEIKVAGVEELQSRLECLGDAEETTEPLTDEEIRSAEEEVPAIMTRLEELKQQAAEEARACEEAAKKSGEPIIKDESEVRDMFEVNSVEYRNLWIKNLQGTLTEEEKRDYASGSTNAVPTIVADKFFEKMKKLAPMLSEITLFRVAGNLQFVSEGTRNAATAKHTENTELAASADTTVAVKLGGFEFMKIIKISRTAALMSIDAFEGWIVDMLAGDIARAVDNYILNDATNGIAAITYTTLTQIVNTATTGFTYDNVVDLIAMLPAAYDAEAKFLVNKKTLYGQIAKIKDKNDNPIFVPDTVSGVGGRLMGFPVVVDDYVTSDNAAVYLGKWTDVVGNLPEAIHVDSDESAGFTSNSIVYRGLAVFDSKPAKTDAIVRLVSTTA